MDVYDTYFPELEQEQKQQLRNLKACYEEWNARINVISRKDMDQFEVHHVLHSISVYKFYRFNPGTLILDIGTGGGFPGIPLAILFPASEFHLCDSIGKKLKVAAEVCQKLDIRNIRFIHERAEKLKGRYDYVVSRAVAPASELMKWTHRLLPRNTNLKPHAGWIFWKGGDLNHELSDLKNNKHISSIYDKISHPFFETKKLIYIEK